MTFHRVTTIDSNILAMRDSVTRHELFCVTHGLFMITVSQS